MGTGSVPFMGAVNPALHMQGVDVPFSCEEGLLIPRKTPASAGQLVHVVLPESSFTRFSRVVRVSVGEVQLRYSCVTFERK
jgi:hypothetical protein